MRRNPNAQLGGSSLSRTDTALERDAVGEIVGSSEREQGWNEDEQGNRVSLPPSTVPITSKLIVRLREYFQTCIEKLRWPAQEASTKLSSLLSAFGFNQGGRPRKHASDTDRVRAFRQKKSEERAYEKMLRKVARMEAETPVTKGRIRGEIRSGGRSVQDLQEFNQSSTLGPASDSFGPSLGGSFMLWTKAGVGDASKGISALSKTGGAIGDRRRNTFDPDKPTPEDTEEPNESESKSTRRQNWSINWTLSAKEEEEYTKEFVDDHMFPVLWCPWPRQHDIDEEGLLAYEDEDESHLRVVLRCWLPMSAHLQKECGAPKGTQCIFCTDLPTEICCYDDDNPDDPQSWIGSELREQARAHIEQEHGRELRAYLNQMAPAKAKKCSTEDHSRMQLEQVLARQRDKVRCGRCNKIIYDPAKNHPDEAIRQLYK